MTHSERTDRRLDIVLGLVAVVTIGILLLALFALPGIFESADNSAAVREANEMQACRALYSFHVNDADSEMDLLITEGLQASVRRDREQVAEIAARIDTTTKKLRDALEAQRRAVELSLSDPAKFLEECRR